MKVGWLVGFNVGLQLRCGLLSTIWDSSQRIIRRRAITVLIFHGGNRSPALVPRGIIFHRGQYTHNPMKNSYCTKLSCKHIIWLKSMFSNLTIIIYFRSDAKWLVLFDARSWWLKEIISISGLIKEGSYTKRMSCIQNSFWMQYTQNMSDSH